MHSSSVGALDPPKSLVGQLVESGHGQLEMLLFRVLDFVVGNSMEALDEHHDGGDAGAGDFGGVVERAGGEAMRFGADLGNGLVAERDEIVVEKNGLDLPEAFPGNGDVPFARETLAGFACFGEHAGKSGGA